MINLSQSIRVGLFFIFGLALIWTVHETFTESNLYSDYGYEVKAPFDDIKQLKKGADVRLAGVSIGAVSATVLEGGKAVVTLNIEEGFNIPDDSVATITTAGLLGNNYVSIDLGSSSALLEPRGTIKTKNTPDINQVISDVGELGKKFEKLIDNLNGEGTGDFFGGVNRLVDDIRPRIEEVLENMQTVSGRLADGTGTLGKLIKSDEAYNKLLSATDDVGQAARDASAFMKDAHGIIDGIDEGKGALSVLLHDEKVANDIKNAVANINEFSEKLNSNKSTLGRLVTSDELYVQAEGILNKVEGAVDSIENSGPITAVGIVAGALF